MSKKYVSEFHKRKKKEAKKNQEIPRATVILPNKETNQMAKETIKNLVFQLMLNGHIDRRGVDAKGCVDEAINMYNRLVDGETELMNVEGGEKDESNQ